MTQRYTAYTIVKRDKKDDFWLNIGVAFPHDDGKGFNVFLQALPISDGKIVLREAEAQKAETDDSARQDDRRADAPPSRDKDRRDDKRTHTARR